MSFSSTEGSSENLFDKNSNTTSQNFQASPRCGNSTDPYDGYGCPSVYDSVLCWPSTPPNTTLSIPCSLALHKVTDEEDQPISHEAIAFRDCLENGTWAKMANYDQCLAEMNKLNFEFSTMRVVTLITFCGSVLSLALLLITFYIFVTFRSIQCSRLSVHKNLVVALMMHFVLNLVWVEPFVTGIERKPSYRQVEWGCKTLLCLKMFAQLSSTNWLFNEGFYLHSRITINIFNSDAPFRFFHTLGWGFSALCVMTWGLVMHYCVDPEDGSTIDNPIVVDKCWKGYSNYAYIWILAGPMCIALFLNFVFLVNIVRILVTKLRANSTPEADQLRKAMKAVGVLFGYLGFSNFIFFINPKDGGAWEDAYYLINAVLQSSQGIVVSILYCFMSADVRLALAKKYYRLKVRWKSRNLRGETNTNNEIFFLRSTDWQRNRRTIQYRTSNRCSERPKTNFERKRSSPKIEEDEPVNQPFETRVTQN